MALISSMLICPSMVLIQAIGGWTGCCMTASIASVARSALWHLIDYWATATKR